MSVVIRKAYDERTPVRFDCVGESRTQQSFKDQCDVNNILKRFEDTGLAEHVKEHGGVYDDFVSMPADYHEAMSSVVKAQQMFEELPAKLRKRFGNDPGDFLKFVDTADDAAMREVGLLPPVVPPDPPKADPAASEPKASEPDPGQGT
jgi:phage internal scaffolding protein